METASSSSADRAFLIFRRLLHACEKIQSPSDHEGLVSSSCTQATSLRHLKYAQVRVRYAIIAFIFMHARLNVCTQYIKQLSGHFDKVQKLKDFGNYDSVQ